MIVSTNEEYSLLIPTAGREKEMLQVQVGRAFVAYSATAQHHNPVGKISN